MSNTKTSSCKNIKMPCKKLTDGKEIPCLGVDTRYAQSRNVDLPFSMNVAVKNGYRLFDTAWINSNYPAFKHFLQDLKKEFNGEISREDLYLVTKLWNTHHSPEMVRHEVNETLKNMGVDYIDLYLIHWPMGFKETPDRPERKENEKNVEFSDVNYIETYKTLEEFVKSGKIKSVGVCNFNIAQLQDILKNCTVKPVVNQIEVHPYLQNEKLIEFCSNNGIHIMAYSPYGIIDVDGVNKQVPNLFEEQTIKDIANKYKKTPAQVCIRWCLNRGMTCIPLTLYPDYLKENSEVFDFKLNDEDMQKIRKLNKNLRIFDAHEYKSHKFYPFNNN